MSVPDLQTKSQHCENFASLGRLNRLAGKLYRSNPVNKKALVMDISSDDVHQLLRNLNRYNVKYLLVGGMAGVVYGHIRTTQDMDLWTKNAPDNTKALVEQYRRVKFRALPYSKECHQLSGGLPFALAYPASNAT